MFKADEMRGKLDKIGSGYGHDSEGQLLTTPYNVTLTTTMSKEEYPRIIAKMGIPSEQYHKRLEIEAASGKGFIFHKFSVRNSGASSGDVRKLR